MIQLGLPGRADRAIATTDEVSELLRAGSPVAIGVSGGKDSCAAALATVAYLDQLGHTGPRVLVHSDLGRVEWKESLPVCERLAAALGIELFVVRRKAGDMMDRWLVRWRNNVARYVALECVKVILPWSTPSMRFCTSELKTAVICSALVKRWPGQRIISVAGIRRDESAKRKHTPTTRPQKRLTNRRHRTSGIDWHPIADWTSRDVFSYLKAEGCALHEAYTRYGMSRVSCAFCIMSNAADLVAATTCEDNHAIYREMVDLEIASTFAFHGDSWLGDVAPHLLTEGQLAGLAEAKRRAAVRQAIEERIPEHLLFEEGWPNVMPTEAEAELLCEVRREVGRLLGLQVDYTDPESLIARYAELMATGDRKRASKAAKGARKAAREAAEELS